MPLSPVVLARVQPDVTMRTIIGPNVVEDMILLLATAPLRSVHAKVEDNASMKLTITVIIR